MAKLTQAASRALTTAVHTSYFVGGAELGDPGGDGPRAGDRAGVPPAGDRGAGRRAG